MLHNNKNAHFAALHKRPGTFVIPNPWDVGSAKMLTTLGAEALATTSAGYSFAKGVNSSVGTLTRTEVLSHAKEIVDATHLPVSADLENGYGDSPEEVSKTIELAIEIGLAGCTIEDATGDIDNPLYDKSLAIERITAAVETARRLDPNFVLTARAENYLFGRNDLDDTLERLLGYETVGAHVLYAPGLPDVDTIQRVCKTVNTPINVVAGIGLAGVTFGQLQTAGVKRISLGSALSRVAYGAMISTFNKILQTGSFDDFSNAASFSALDSLNRRADQFI